MHAVPSHVHFFALFAVGHMHAAPTDVHLFSLFRIANMNPIAKRDMRVIIAIVGSVVLTAIGVVVVAA